ncbi:1-acyl-sn-glycerol-3-phosphate acyltransferase [Prevotella sp. Rep29]|uniref:1-acyl-sn-glycerol-3-phosphate acyltransferase n=1 Tax=Prevotella sp. Rep29 TaxID=2691580 RepID=UPI001C6EA50F|nr:1-acyl-sn-glycerol-3-phosphate acyltransferase [Prevotella sp. Rep29]QYR10348.1 acyltransferase [Prevotella sp. Rep29]
MWKKFCNWLLYSRLGWRKNVTETLPEKCIICLAPHTSNWDFLLGQLYAGAEGLRINFLMKSEWFVWPLGVFFKRLGGIPVHRDRKSSLTDVLADTATKSDTFRLCVTPEGTRSANADWKKGFYYIAVKAGIPILLYGIDYKDRLIECSKSIMPSGDIENEMTEIKDYFRPFKGKYPEKFAL